MRCEVAHRHLTGVADALITVKTRKVERRPEGRQSLTDLSDPVVVEEEVLSAGERVPRLESLDVDDEGGIAAAAMLAPRPLRARDDRHGACLRVGEGDVAALVIARQIGEWLTRAPFHRLESLNGEPAVGRAGQGEDGLAGVDVGDECRAPRSDAVSDNSVSLREPFHLGTGLEGHPLRHHAEGIGEWAKSTDALADRAVVALHDDELGRGLAGDEVHLPGAPVLHDSPRHGHLIGRVVQQGNGDEVTDAAEVPLGQLPDSTCEALEDVVVAACLPGRVDRRREGVHIGVHVGRGQIMLLVPRRGGQQDVAEETRARHAEVDAHEQVELADRRLVTPGHVGGACILRRLVGAHGVVGAEDVPQEELVALARRPEQIRSPHGEDARPVLRGVGIIDREVQSALTQLLCDVIGRSHPRFLCFGHEIQGVAIELRVRRHPSRARRLRDGVDHRAAFEATLAKRTSKQIRAEPVIAPLIGVDVPECRADHLSRRPSPVEAEGELCPARDGAALLLTHVVGPAAAIDPLRATQRRK